MGSMEPPFLPNKTFPVFSDQTPSTKVLVVESLIWMCGSIVEAPIRECKIAKSLMKANFPTSWFYYA